MLDNSERNEDEMKNSVTQLENSGEKRRGRMAYVEDTFFFCLSSVPYKQRICKLRNYNKTWRYSGASTKYQIFDL